MKRCLLIAILSFIPLSGLYAQTVFSSKGFSFECSVGGHIMGEAAAEAAVGLGFGSGKGWRVSGGLGYTGSTHPNEGKRNDFISAYIDGKYSFHDRNLSPYIGVRVKGQHMIDPDMGKLFVYDYDRYTESEQLFVLAQVGIDIKDISFWIGFGPHMVWEVEHSDSEIRNPHGNASPEITPSKDTYIRYINPCLALGAVLRL